MPKFLFVYHGGKMAETPEEAQADMAKWMAWFEAIGEQVVDAGAPVGMSTTVSDTGVEDDGGANPVSGYSVISADDINAAANVAKSCPIIGTGTIEIAEVVEM